MTTPTVSLASEPKAYLAPAYVWMISSVAALGGLLFGYDWVVIGGAAGTFGLYAGICVAGLFFLFFRLPETRGKILEIVEGDFNQH